jgi:L-ascorbate metabolism protein UlaG (beta-lactamase superfamily)
LWRSFSNWAKTKPLTLRLASALGRSRGRTRLLDRLLTPAPAPLKPDLTHWHQRKLAAVWIGHATVLLRVDGMNILTDPVLSGRIGLGLGLITAGPARHIAPGLRLHELPPIDLVLVSHAHFDHLDRPTLCRLSRRIPVITSEHNADLIRDLGFHQVSELRWGQSLRVSQLNITAQPVQHWGARYFLDQHRGFAAFVIEGGGQRVLYAGDTGYHQHFRGLGPVDLAIFGIGAYDPYLHAHANPEQVWAMADHARARHILPMHHSTFRLSHEPMDEPLARLRQAAGRSEDRLVIHQVGGMWHD